MGSQILTNLEIEGERQWGQKLGAVFYSVEELLAIKLDEPKKKKKILCNASEIDRLGEVADPQMKNGDFYRSQTE